MEMMKKIMEAVTHLMKSFERKERNTMIQREKPNSYGYFFLFSTGRQFYSCTRVCISTAKFYILFENCSHHKRPQKAFKPLIEFGGVSEQQEESSQELQQGNCHKGCCPGCRKTHKRYEGQSLQRQLEIQRDRYVKLVLYV